MTALFLWGDKVKINKKKFIHTYWILYIAMLLGTGIYFLDYYCMKVNIIFIEALYGTIFAIICLILTKLKTNKKNKKSR